MVIVPLRVPDADGEKVTCTEQLLPAETVTGPLAGAHVPVCAKSPSAAMLAMLRSLVPMFCTQTVSSPLVVWMTWLPKLTLGTDTAATGAIPVPDKLSTNCPLFVPTV